MPLNDIADLWEDPHLHAVGLLGLADHPSEGRYRTIGQPARFFGTPGGPRRHAPKPGQDTREVLLEAGLAPGAVDALIRAGIAREPPRHDPASSEAAAAVAPAT